MAVDNILRTFGDASAVEDVLGIIEILTARENHFLTRLAKTNARNTIHAVLTDTLLTPASLAVSEAAAASFSALTTPTRTINLVESIAAPYSVSGVQKAIDHYQAMDEEVRQARKAMEDWGKQAVLPRILVTVLQSSRKLLETPISYIYQSVKMVHEGQSAAKLCFLSQRT